MLSQQEILNQQMLQMQQLQMANQQRLHQSQPVLNPQQQPVNGQRPMSQQMGYVTQQVVPTAQPMGPATQQIQAPIVQQVIQQQHAQQTAQLQQQYVTQQNGVQYVQLSNGMLIPMVTQQQGQQTQPQVAQQNYIVPNQQPVQQPQQPTNTTDASSKPVSSFNKHTYSSIPEKGKQPKTDVSDSKNAQRAQLAISQDAGLKCSQI